MTVLVHKVRPPLLSPSLCGRNGGSRPEYNHGTTLIDGMVTCPLCLEILVLHYKHEIQLLKAKLPYALERRYLDNATYLQRLADAQLNLRIVESIVEAIDNPPKQQQRKLPWWRRLLRLTS